MIFFKGFRWYLENIYRETQLPINYRYLGDIKNMATGHCLDTLGRKNGDKLGMSLCHQKGGNQLFVYTKNKQIISNENCLDATKVGKPVKIIRCHHLGGNQMWEYNLRSRNLVHIPSKMCLDKPNAKDPKMPTLRRCMGRKSQRWHLKNNFEWQLPSQYE